MKVESFGKANSNGVMQQWTRIKCDVCPAVLEYRGTPQEALAKIKGNAWSIGSTGLVRCREDTQVYLRTVMDVLGKRSTEGLPT